MYKHESKEGSRIKFFGINVKVFLNIFKDPVYESTAIITLIGPMRKKLK